jgi:hypothetical protein
MKITIETIPHKDQRYSTIGDWRFIGPDLLITVSQEILNKEDGVAKAMLIGIHELVEAFLCWSFGISQESVDAFDMAMIPSSVPEPGDLPGAPYHDQHVVAEMIERMLASYLMVNWEEYEEEIETFEDFVNLIEEAIKCQPTSQDQETQTRG